MRLSVKIPDANSVQASQTSIFNKGIGRRYHDERYQLTNITVAQVGMVRVKANGENILQMTGPELDSINQFDGRAAATSGGATILTIGYDRFNLYNQDGEERTAIQTGTPDPDTGAAITTFSTEIDLTAGPVAPAIKATATQSTDNPKLRKGPGLIRRFMRYPIAFGAGGDMEISTLPKGTEGPKFQVINRIFFKTAATALRVERDNQIVFQRDKALNDRLQADGVRVPQAGWFVLDFTEEGYEWEGLWLVDDKGKPYQDLRFILSLPGAETTVAIVEYLGSLQG